MQTHKPMMEEQKNKYVNMTHFKGNLTNHKLYSDRVKKSLWSEIIPLRRKYKKKYEEVNLNIEYIT